MDQNAAGEIEKPAAMANCLMILNADQNAVVTSVFGESDEEEFVFVSRKFECKTCNRKFSSFQALGGHCASHKKTKPPLSDDVKSPSEPKAHGCKICGAEFPIGQALGGHMRRHREFLEGHDGNFNDATTTGKVEEIIDEKKLSIMSGVTAEGSSGSSDGDDGGVAGNKRKIYDGNGVVSVSKNSSSKRVCLDLSLWWNHEQLEEYVAAAATATSAENDNKKINDDDNNNEIEEGEIVEQHEEEEKDFLKLELRLPHQ